MVSVGFCVVGSDPATMKSTETLEIHKEIAPQLKIVSLARRGPLRRGGTFRCLNPDAISALAFRRGAKLL